MRVLKFGGTSLSNAQQFMCVANIINKNSKKEQIAVVLSAPATITNYLVLAIDNTLHGLDVLKSIYSIKNFFITLIKDITQIQSEFNSSVLNSILEKEFDRLKKLLYGVSLLNFCPDNINADIICLGEKLSVVLMKEILTTQNLKVIVLDPVKVIVTRGGYSTSIVNIEESTQRIQSISIACDEIVLMAGFTGGNKYGELVTLGRNGSDYSAAILSACLRANLCEIWTDVDGIYTCDPHQVPDAKLLRTLSYTEAMELSYFGAKILHPRTIVPIAQFHIPCLIKNIFNPDGSGTLIGSSDNITTNIVKGITYLKNMVMLNISGPGMKGMIGMAARVFASMSRAECSVVLITQSSSEYSISLCVPNQECEKACDALNEEFHLELKNRLLEPIDSVLDLAIISVVGDGMRTQLGLAGKLFGALARANVNIIAITQGSSERSISVVVKNNVTAIGVKTVHQVLFSTDQVIDAFIIGVGGVGNALIKQIYKQYFWLKNKRIDLRVCGIINSQIMFINMDGIDLNHWKSLLMQSQELCDLKKLITIIQKYHLLNPVIVDCTSSLQVANCYVDFLLGGCHVIAPNKKANTGSMEYYKKLRSAVTASRRKFLYDTNVGAGLPVIENLQNLLSAGDELIRFSGILSGSLSYIFGKIDEGLSLSKAILLAKENGYTEPDPRDDLSGVDVARKLLVLAREVGYELELKDIYIEPVIPNNILYNNFHSINDFFKRLSSLDNYFICKINEAKKLGRVLRYIGNIQKGECCVKIEFVDHNHPLCKVKDGENALAFFTQYYQPLPLILRGYGAGNNVTAAGVFADLLRTLS
ncbi:bifunctional aspartokinase/homoserine dehydrogenase 1 [Candidatus Blochmanniella vafra str. BVAF]|uniref:Bifunctional aspartokinase/homoserine dehydrogenase n=1 Tax=Blochmanniella vafra (strain BVAF) TaxID=859654 RepID=E8Q5M2_BLOVB|nr:bifunctional aspartate kinase/homoserine dehydrogenase I [Candidatus Blochmannia vafer]ADV33519.1 bifunctional aspartokinase/homoserine dehydrogenase 1 [Candidatus Blochmannia vafer str. BVAF]